MVNELSEIYFGTNVRLVDFESKILTNYSRFDYFFLRFFFLESFKNVKVYLHEDI